MDNKSEKCSHTVATGQVVDIIIKIGVKYLDFFCFIIYKKKMQPACGIPYEQNLYKMPNRS
jgi:hypothetical protein